MFVLNVSEGQVMSLSGPLSVKDGVNRNFTESQKEDMADKPLSAKRSVD